MPEPILSGNVHIGQHDEKLKQLLTYCERGWRIFPVWEIEADGHCACRGPCDRNAGKHPIGYMVSNGHKDASSDPEQIIRWHEQRPTANWGWALVDHFVLDLDPRNGFPLEDLNNWEVLFGFPLPVTLVQWTGGGGCHIIFAADGHDVRNGKLHRTHSYEGKTWRSKVNGVDVKGVGGYILVAPSNHKSGGLYALDDASRMPTGPSVDLLEMINRNPGSSAGDGNSEGAWNGEREWPGERLERWLTGDVPPGEQFTELTSFLGWARNIVGKDQAMVMVWASAQRWAQGVDERGNLLPAWTQEELWKHVNGFYENTFRGSDAPGLKLDEAQLAWARHAAGVADEDPGREAFEAALRTETGQQVIRLLSRRAAEQHVTRAERVELVVQSAREFVRIPPPDVVMYQVLAAEVNLLGGPSEAGKSLVARDWALHVAAGEAWRGHRVERACGVLWVASEGTHDFGERWTSQPLWERAADRIFVVESPVNLLDDEFVTDMITKHARLDIGLAVFDVIYGMGMADDNGVKDVVPVINALKRISREWRAATLALGHNGHNGSRRFRGSSMWRQLAAVEWHMADGSLTCEKSKIADKRTLAASYQVEYPAVRWLTSGQAFQSEVERRNQIAEELDARPEESVLSLARRLAPLFNLSESRTRSLITEVKKRRESQD